MVDFANDFIISENGVLKEYNGTSTNVIIPDGVKKIGESAFVHNSVIQSITVPNSVTEIGEQAFYNCALLRSVVIHSEEQVMICRNAFRDCKNLTVLLLPEQVLIGESAFRGCDGLADENGFVVINGVLLDYIGTDKEVSIPNNIRAIGTAFANNYVISHVQMTESDIKSIGSQAFWCSSIRTIEFPSGLVVIGDSAFRDSKLETAALPSDLKRIQRGTFLGCTQLKKASLPEGLEEIGHNAFQWCYKLEEINIPSTVRKFGKVIFEDCKALKKLNCFDNFVIQADTFGETFPIGLIGSLESLENNMTTAAYQKYVLKEKVWSRLNPDTQLEFFIKRNSKGSLFEYSKCIKADDVDRLGTSLLKKAEEEESKDLNRAMCNFLLLFYDFSEKELAKRIYSSLKKRNNTGKLIAELEQSNVLTCIMNEKAVSYEQRVDQCSTATDLSYETIDSLPDDYFAEISDFDLSSPIKTKLKKTIISLDKLKFIVKIQSDQTLNNQLWRWSDDLYDPISVINNKMCEEHSEMVRFYDREQPEEIHSIAVKAETKQISKDAFTKRLMFFAKIVDSLQSEDVLRIIIEMMPKKKNGTLYLKRSVVIAPVAVTNKELGLQVLCAKAIKDTEAEVSLKYYSFERIEEVIQFLKTADESLRSIMKVWCRS